MLDFTFCLHYSSGPYASFASTSPVVLSIRVRLTPGDRSPRESSTETLFSDAPFRDRALV
jgi:hypothetical protein